MPNYRRAYLPGGTYFFTVVTCRRRHLFHHEMARHSLNQAIAKTQPNYPFEAKVFARKNFCLETIEAWVLLPDNLHCIWTLPSGDNV